MTFIKVITGFKAQALRHVSGGFRVHVLMKQGKAKKIQTLVVVARLLETGECVGQAIGQISTGLGDAWKAQRPTLIMCNGA